jgi:hypothetical protein
VTGLADRDDARVVRAAYYTARGLSEEPPHPEFARSNDAAGRFLRVRCAALGLHFLPSATPPSQRSAYERSPLLHALFSPDVLRAEAATSFGEGGRYRVRCIEDYDRLPHPLRLRLALLDRFDLPPWLPCGGGAFEDAERAKHNALYDRRQRYLEECVERLSEALRGASTSAETAAMMEHNRWMGERLLSGWRFGTRDDARRCRVTLVPWSDLSAKERMYDRVGLARKILEEGPKASSHSAGSRTTSPAYHAYLLRSAHS